MWRIFETKAVRKEVHVVEVNRMSTKQQSGRSRSRNRVAKSELVPARVSISITPGEMLRTIRELQELTQSELAARTGMAQSNLSALETGARELGRERALVLAKALKVHPAVILFPDFDVSEVV